MTSKIPDLETIAQRIWHHSPQDKFQSYDEFKIMFDAVTERAWEAIVAGTFNSKEEFALVYWTDFQEKNLRRQPRTDRSKKANNRKSKKSRS